MERTTTLRTALWYVNFHFVILVQIPIATVGECLCKNVVFEMSWSKYLFSVACYVACHSTLLTSPTAFTHIHTRTHPFHLPPVHFAQPKDMARICEERQSFRANLGTLGADTRYVTLFDVSLMCACGHSYALRCKLLQATCKWPSHVISLPTLSLSFSYHLSPSSQQLSKFCPGQIR